MAKTQAKKADTIKLPEFAIKKLKVKILGPSLIVHAWDEKIIKQLEDIRAKKAKAARGAKDPIAEFEGCKYKDEKGRDAIPSIAVKHAMVSAARFLDDLPMTVLKGAFFVEGYWLPLTFKKCEMRRDLVRVGGKGPGTGAPDLRYRPEYHDWSVVVPIEYNSAAISAEQILQLLRTAGFCVGLHEWRPEKGGVHGRFDIDSEAAMMLGAA